jgi:hypothetical protein
MILKSQFKIIGNACIERAVGTFQDVEVIQYFIIMVEYLSSLYFLSIAIDLLLNLGPSASSGPFDSSHSLHPTS